MIVGVGIDLVEIERLRGTLARFGQRFESRVFTELERAYCRSQSESCVVSLAGRFAAKEAFVKALGTGVAQGISWQDVAVERGAAGRPILLITGEAGKLANAAGVLHAHVSFSHTATHAIAVVILEG